MDQVRRDLGERIDQLTAAKESELARLHALLQSTAQTQTAPVKKIVIDDDVR